MPTEAIQVQNVVIWRSKKNKPKKPKISGCLIDGNMDGSCESEVWLEKRDWELAKNWCGRKLHVSFPSFLPLIGQNIRRTENLRLF
mmetsp:Transcript_26333/g.64182  ORF Transcript_26333/g.64182 Transcript_26333/m.64182 type:complete len:86 (+) Transcript_26333:652-909(+)